MTYLIVNDAVRPNKRMYWNRHQSAFVSEVSPQCYFLTTYTAGRMKQRLLDFYRFTAIKVISYNRACDLVNALHTLTLESLPNFGSKTLGGWND